MTTKDKPPSVVLEQLIKDCERVRHVLRCGNADAALVELTRAIEIAKGEQTDRSK